jgi:hypothetical protein
VVFHKKDIYISALESLMSKYVEMSDAEFIKLLNSKLQDASWNVGEIVELESRGISIVESYPELSRGILKKRAEFTYAMNRALEPYSKQFEILSDSINRFKDLQLGKALASNPRLENQLISTPKTAQDVVFQEVANILDQSLLELQGIRRQSQRDWFQWSILISSIVGAVTAIVSVIFL